MKSNEGVLRHEFSDLPRLVVVGGTGNTGSATLKLLRQWQPDREILALVRPSTDVSPLVELKIEYHVCNILDETTFYNVLRPDDILVEMANLRYARKLLPVFERIGGLRAFCITTTAVYSRHHSYSSLYKQIEQEMRSSKLDVTILRPSMIYGNHMDHNMHKLIRYISTFPIFPIFGTGRALMQPVHVDDLSYGIAKAICLDAPGEFNLAGPDPLSYREIVDIVFQSLNKRGLMIFLPTRAVENVVSILQKIPMFPIRHEQVVRLQEDKVFDIVNSKQILGYLPRDFRTGIRQEIDTLRRHGILPRNPAMSY